MRWIAITALALVFPVFSYPSPSVAEEDVVHVSSLVNYDARPDQGPVRVAWDVNFKNNDPETSPPGSSGEVYFYQNVTVPMLRGATAISAVSSAGSPLDVTLTDEGPGPTVSATISFDERVFLGESYDFHLAYELAEVRGPSLLVTPTYVYLPLIAGGDEAKVTVNYPSGGDWSVSLEEAECGKEGAAFACSGQDSGFLAALLEISRPEAVAVVPFDVPLAERTVSVELRYFAGEEGAADHLRELATAALPIIEKQYGFAYPGQDTVTISQGGRQAILGYEGLASCQPDGECFVTVSPAADDLTFIHELTHLWSHVYGKRWISEGFAQLVAEDTAAALPEGLVQTHPEPRELSTTLIALDDWGSVSSLIDANQWTRDMEQAGYDRSAQLLRELRTVVGSDALRRANAVIASSSSSATSSHSLATPATSERFLDALEEASGERVDGLFAELVFPDTFAETLALRRQARDRLAALYQAAADKGLSTSAPDGVRSRVEGWQFQAALDSLDEADRKLAEYDVVKRAIELLGERAEAVGLALPATVIEGLHDWDFASVRLNATEAARVIDTYREASASVESGHNIWERIGLIGESPRGQLEAAAQAFADGDLAKSTERASEARETVDDASDSAFRRVLLLGLLGCLVASVVWGAFWFTGRREREYAGL